MRLRMLPDVATLSDLVLHIASQAASPVLVFTFIRMAAPGCAPLRPSPSYNMPGCGRHQMLAKRSEIALRTVL